MKTLVAALARGIKVHEEVDHFRRVVVLRRVAQFLSHTGKLQALFLKTSRRRCSSPGPCKWLHRR